MKQLFILSVIFISSSTLLAQNRQLSTQDLQDDFNVLKTHLNKYHPDKYLYTPKLVADSIATAIEKELQQPMSDLTFYRKLIPIIASIRNNHTTLMPPQSYLDSMKAAKRFPILFYYKSDTLWSFKDASKEYEIQEGRMITRINDRNAIELITEMTSLLSPDGFSKSAILKQASEHFLSYYALFYGLPSSFTVSYLNQDGEELTTIIKPITIPTLKTNLKKRYSTTEQYSSPFDLKINNKTAVLTIKTFQPKNSFNYRRFIKSTFRQINNLQIEHLIIDVQGNRGGFPEASNYLLSYLVNKKVNTTIQAYALVDQLRQPNYFIKDGFYKHFNRKRLKQQGDFYHTNDAKKSKIKPKSNRFTGQLYVLLDEESASAAAEFLGLSKSYTNAIFIGRESSGNPVTQVATDIVLLKLPHSKIRMRFPLIKTELNVNFKNNGRGLVPDYPVYPTIQERLNNENIALDKAFELIKDKKRATQR